jgi:hypothetical protein
MLRFFQRHGVRRGVFGGSRAWLWVAILTTGLRVLARVVGRSEQVVYRHELEPGQTLVIAHEREATVEA